MSLVRANLENSPGSIKKIAIVLPVAYDGGSLRGAYLLAQALEHGSKLAKEPVEIIFTRLDAPIYQSASESEHTKNIKQRSYNWKFLDNEQAQKAMHYAGQINWQAEEPLYAVIDDGMQYMNDCDLWIIISDRLQAPLLPLKPHILMVYDYIQRYVPEICPDDTILIKVARLANQLWTTTTQSQNDALQYAGVSAEKAKKMPMLVPEFAIKSRTTQKKNYFLWTTNFGAHKNHSNSFRALQYYYEELDGQLECHITGVNTERLLTMADVGEVIDDSSLLKEKIKLFGNLPQDKYEIELQEAAFLWHTAKIDNGTFSVIEAFQVETPSLSTTYPAMREINELFQLNIAWMEGHDPQNMALQLKWMEENFHKFNFPESTKKKISAHYFANQAVTYWQAVREWL